MWHSFVVFLPWLGIPLYNKPRFGLRFLGIFEKKIWGWGRFIGGLFGAY